jgi:hypothetical protein
MGLKNEQNSCCWGAVVVLYVFEDENRLFLK